MCWIEEVSCLCPIRGTVSRASVGRLKWWGSSNCSMCFGFSLRTSHFSTYRSNSTIRMQIESKKRHQKNCSLWTPGVNIVFYCLHGSVNKYHNLKNKRSYKLNQLWNTKNTYLYRICLHFQNFVIEKLRYLLWHLYTKNDNG